MNRKLTAGRYTVCINTDNADDTTYQNWRTFKLTRSGKGTYDMSVLSNAEGNGQTWDAIGTIRDNCLLITDYAAHSTPFSFDSLLLTCVSLFGSLKCADSNVKVPGTFPNARVWRIKHNSKVTAAPSLLRPNNVRDRNVDQMRLKVGGGFDSRFGGTNPLMEAMARKRQRETQVTRMARYEVAGVKVAVEQYWCEQREKWIATMR